MKVLSYIISLIFLWSTGAMAFAPGFLQVAGGGGTVSCTSGVVTNGCFDNGTTGWGTIASPIFTVTNGIATVTNNGTSYPQLYQTGKVTNGVTYNYTVVITEIINGGEFRLKLGGTLAVSIDTAGIYTGTGVAGADGEIVLTNSYNTDTSGFKIDTVSVSAQ